MLNIGNMYNKVDKDFVNNSKCLEIYFNNKIKEFYYFDDTDIFKIDNYILRNKIEELLPKGTYLSHHNTHGENKIGFGWFIKNNEVDNFIKKLKAWIAYEELDECYSYYSISDKKFLVNEAGSSISKII